MTAIEYLDRPVADWFVLDVMRTKERASDWAALMIDVDPESWEFQRHACPVQSCWVRILGKHRNQDAAWDALQDMMVTKH